MVHDLLGIQNNIADLSHIPNTRQELHRIVLSTETDSFFGKNMYSGFGDLGEKVKEIVVDYQRKHEGSKKVESVEDMKRFLEDYPEVNNNINLIQKSFVNNHLMFQNMSRLFRHYQQK